MKIGYSFAISEVERFKLAFVENLIEHFTRRGLQKVSHLLLVSLYPVFVFGKIDKRPAMAHRGREEPVKECFLCRSSSHRQEVYDLDEETCVALARFTHSPVKLSQARDITIMAYSEQWTA